MPQDLISLDTSVQLHVRASKVAIEKQLHIFPPLPEVMRHRSAHNRKQPYAQGALRAKLIPKAPRIHPTFLRYIFRHVTLDPTATQPADKYSTVLSMSILECLRCQHQFTTKANLCGALCAPLASCANTVTLYVPGVVGVPVSAPDPAFNPKPSGSGAYCHRNHSATGALA